LSSLTVAVAVDVELPSARIEAGLSATATSVGWPTACLKVVAPATLGETELSVAAIVNVPAVVVAVIVD
jgi:hypothetical protein